MSASVPEPTVERLGAGVHAYVQLDGSWGLNNAGFLVADDGVLVIDTCFTERRARRLHAAIRDRTDAPIRVIANTHHHGDHTFGNVVLAEPGTTIVAHERCRTEMIESGLATTALFPGVEWGEIRIAPPTVTFTDRLDLWIGETKVEAHFIGPAHTSNDVVYWLPEQRILFAGDLLFNGGTPFVLMGTVAGSLAAYERLRAFPAETVVPGHGPVCDLGLADDMVAYLRWLDALGRDAFARGLAPLEAAEKADLGGFAAWHDRERLVGNLHRLYAELRGEPPCAPLDLQAVVADMIAYNDGRPLRCLA